ncbi:MAG: FHA domain-containing protein [Polyangiaceae bacterium]|nr:FHA domain-containing protein [Polyangiaceae bacterium]
MLVRTSKRRADGAPAEPSLTFDTPRLVIGRGDGCELRLPDPSVSARHASIRQRGADHVLIDESSTNGTFLGKRRLSPQTPEPLRDGDLVRVGRVWLAIRIAPAAARTAGAAAAKELALELVARGLAAQGEDPAPRVHVMQGPGLRARDAERGPDPRMCDGPEATLRLEQPGRPYVIGRGKDADLALESADIGRRHVAVTRRGDHFLVRDLGAPQGTLLDGAPLPQTDTPWRPGQILLIGAIQLTCEHPAAEALAELERSPDEPMRPGEAPEPPVAPEPTPAPRSVDELEEPPASVDLGAAPLAAPTPTPPPVRASTAGAPSGWGITDAAILLLALGILVLSIAGLFWLLGRG